MRVPTHTPPGGIPIQAPPTAGAAAISTQCTWWGAGYEAPAGKCPQCGSWVVYHESEQAFVSACVARGMPAGLVHWLRGRCLPLHPGVIYAARKSWEDGRRYGVRLAAGRIRALAASRRNVTEGEVAAVLAALDREIGGGS